MVRFTFGAAGVRLDAMAIWAGVRTPILDDLRFARLDQVGTDHDLALEVFAALLNDQQELLAAYIETKLRKEEPSEISRGIMVAGFSDQNEVNDEILKRYEGSAGLVGSAYKAAKYAYERNVWARHWFEKMCQTDENTDFWCYATLFSRLSTEGFPSGSQITCGKAVLSSHSDPLWKTDSSTVSRDGKITGIRNCSDRMLPHRYS